MHRTTPLASAFRAYSAGGARSVVHSVDDTTLMQTMKGNFLAGESRDNIEAPQNYGFTSVTMDAEQAQGDGGGGGGDGPVGAISQKSGSGPETFSSFIGGNRSFPVAGNIDDRRHRLYQLEKGDTAMFRGRGDKQQFHMTQDGGFWTAPQDKTVRMHLVQQDSESNMTQQSGSAGAQMRIPQPGDMMPDGKRLPAWTRILKPTPRDGSSGGGSSGGGSSSGGGQNQNKGQTALYKDGQQSPMFVEVTKDKTRMGGNTCHMTLSDGNTYVHCNTDKQVYVGAEAGKAQFAKLVTLSGPCVNALGKIG